MSAKNNKKDSLEQFFKKKAAEYDIAYREEDWLRLEKKLDVRDAQIAYQRKVRWIAAAAVFAISLLGYFTYDNYVRLNELNRLLSEDSTHLTEADREIDADRSMDPDRIMGETPVESDDPGPGALINDDAFLSDLDQYIEIPGEVPLQDRESLLQDRESLLPDRDGTRHHLDEALPDDPVVDRGISPLVQVPERFFTFAKDRDEILTSVRWEYIEVPVHARMPQVPGASDDMEPVDRTGVTGLTAIAAMHRKVDLRESKTPVRSRFSIGLVTAPDLSTVSSFSGFSNPGYKIGVTVDYQLTSRLSVSTGLVPSMVRYSAEYREYNLTGYYNSGDQGLVSMAGECLLFDIPITLAYELFDFGKSGLFVSTGLSSYIMLNEEYLFSYERDTGEGIESWSDRTGTRHWFSNAGFSIGYEREITRKISLRAEPYVRIPVREVGWANIRLYSMGSFFSIRYAL